jgi:ribosome-binding protein aMBF1 (putative translation factor)
VPSGHGLEEVCLKGPSMKKKDPPGYPGDEAVTKAVEEALHRLFREKDQSLEEAYATFRKANQKDSQSMVPRALSIVVRRLREERKMSRAQLSRASGLSVRFIGTVERGRAHSATITDIVRIAFGLNHCITDFVSQVDELSKKLEAK